ncbi:MAG TPA: nuclear transport factor 2 family protein [Rhizomicrobium sp.]|nr:nuclear transport factor 2 family protein [Rhizomicrobium sp.]
MSASRISRRTTLAAGSVALAGAAMLSDTANALAESSEMVVRSWYDAWDKKDWDKASAVTTDDFTFTSPAPDDHISKAAYKKNCWDTQLAFTGKFNLELVLAQGNDVLVKYTGETTNGKTFSNVEYFRLRDGRIASLRCYFGGNMSFPSSVSAQ